MITAAAVVAVATVVASLSMRSSSTWRATVTPLASIIGSGFLVVTPLLVTVVGAWAPVAMVGIIAVAYGMGSVMRFVIIEVEPRLEQDDPSQVLADLDRLSRPLLGFAYIVSVAFYVRLMASFVLRAFGEGDLAARLLTTGVLAAIGALGWLRGLDGLELLEQTAVGIKLAIIGGLLAGLLVYDLGDIGGFVDSLGAADVSQDAWTTIRMLAGMLIVVQGFETSRYLGSHYDRPTRVRTMRAAQLLSGAIYVAFVSLSVGLFDALSGEVSETAIIDVARTVTPILGPLLVLAAVASQLSAAVADTAGGGEMLTGTTRAVTNAGVGYVTVTSLSIALVWFTDVFGIVSLASRAFAAYYLSQTLLATIVLVRGQDVEHRWLRLCGSVALMVVTAFVTVFAIPVDG